MNSIKLFQSAQIRSVWNEEEQQWYFSVVDIVGALSNASVPKRYWSDLKRKLKSEGASETYEKIVRLKMQADDKQNARCYQHRAQRGACYQRASTI